ncbi:uncharacterized protein TNCV_3511591 [Trichonephila clavipes]|nr:uncharacterized protein TNCV_3511591 [Trichonephila clavipes]
MLLEIATKRNINTVRIFSDGIINLMKQVACIKRKQAAGQLSRKKQRKETYVKCIKLLHTAYGIAAETLQSEAHSEVRKAYEAPTDVPVVDISVSFDGSWLTRGHTSLIGIACVIDILTGYVIDFEVMCKVCRNCSVAKRKLGESSAEYDIWYECHRKDCDVNHSGSSTSMEMEAALILWERSREMGFRYSTLLSDGDCKTFNYLTEKMYMGINLK